MSEPVTDREIIMHQAHLERVMWDIHRYWARFFSVPNNQQSITASLAQENMELRARVEQLEGLERIKGEIHDTD